MHQSPWCSKLDMNFSRQQPATPRMLGSLSILGLCLLYSLCNGCRSDFSSVLDDYEYRIGNIFPHSPTTQQQTPVTPARYQWPSVSQLTLPWPESTIDLLDSLKLSRCAVALPIMKKNSTLGRFHSQSQRLILESEILHQLPDCIKQHSTDDALAVKLQAAYQEKIFGQQHMVWSALFSSQEFQRFASLSSGMLSIQETHVDINGPQALEHWFSVFEQLSQHRPIPAQPLESSLQSLALNPALGQWIRSTLAILTTLTTTTEHIQVHQNICLAPIKPSEKTRIHRVCHRFFIKDIHPLVSRLKRLGDRLHRDLTGLHAQASHINTVATAKVSHYLDQVFGSLGLYDQLQQRFHQQVQAWQVVLNHCQLLPSQSSKT